ncbi:MAG: DNA-binding protein [Chloroflexota bacterium]|nr:DNA-binding protein [Chloroflexota bacterium]
MNDQDGDSQNDLPAGLGKPAQRALAGAGITVLHGMGPKALGQLRDALSEYGPRFADETPPS